MRNPSDDFQKAEPENLFSVYHEFSWWRDGAKAASIFNIAQPVSF